MTTTAPTATEDATTLGAERFRLITALYFTQYLGVGFLTIGLVAILRDGGTSLATLGMLQTIGLIWPLKFLWAPLVDRFGSRRVGHYRSWLIPLQLGLVITLVDRALVLGLRHDGVPALALLPTVTDRAIAPDEVRIVDLGDPLASTSASDTPDAASPVVRVVHESWVGPRSVHDVDLTTGGSTLLRRQPVRGDWDPERYVATREWVTAEDGAQVPLSVIRRRDVEPDGTAPGLLTGYGSYEISSDPYFSVARLSLLDRGVVFAIAHVRGGGEMGRAWYEQGRLNAKPTTFSDFVACGRHLIDSGWVAPDRLAAEGGSAGGLLIGAAVNLAPDLFRVVHAAVPFVDALTTILRPDLPLTVGEWEEWGNPLEDPAVYAVMKAYAPYENVTATRYPAVLATTSLNDTRVFFTEPAKWVARLREVVTNDPVERPIVLRTELEAGHGGRSGRYDAWRQLAWEWAFVLDQLGA